MCVSAHIWGAIMRIGTSRELGAAVRDRRERLGWTQQKVAQHASVSREWLLRFEAGKGTVPLARVLDVLTALGLSLEVREEIDA